MVEAEQKFRASLRRAGKKATDDIMEIGLAFPITVNVNNINLGDGGYFNKTIVSVCMENIDVGSKAFQQREKSKVKGIIKKHFKAAYANSEFQFDPVNFNFSYSYPDLFCSIWNL